MRVIRSPAPSTWSSLSLTITVLSAIGSWGRFRKQFFAQTRGPRDGRAAGPLLPPPEKDRPAEIYQRNSLRARHPERNFPSQSVTFLRQSGRFAGFRWRSAPRRAVLVKPGPLLLA